MSGGSCSHCQNSPRRMSTCSCGGVSYCDSTCQKADWKKHKSSCPPYKIQEVPGKGKGMVATRNIKAGDVILEETPLLVVNKDQELLQLSQSLSEEEKQKVLSLHDPGVNSFQQEKIMTFLQQTEMSHEGIDEDTVKFTRIVLYNTISVAGEGNVFGINETALYETISRINHSCAPNAFWKWKKGDVYVKEVRALKDIQKGEEVVAAYLLDTFMPRNDRREKLRNWDIDCRCKICSLEGDELKKNEDLRSKIIEQDENIPKYGLNNNLHAAVFAAKEKVNLMSEREDEFISDMLSSWLELYELSFTLGSMANLTGLHKKILDEQTCECKERAFELAKKFGSGCMFRYENKISSLSLVDMLNKNTKGQDLWPVVNEMDRSLYVVTGEVARGVLVRLVQAGMMEEAASIYRWEELVTTGTYEFQDTEANILKLILKSYYSSEELQIIITEFFNKLKKIDNIGDKDVSICMSEEDIPPSGVCLLKEVVSSKKEALNRVCQILAHMVPPMSISVSDVPFIPKEQVQNYVSKGQKSEKAEESNQRSSTKSNEEDYSNLCWSCSKTKTETILFKCTGCKKARYCGRECIEHDWPVHKDWCLKRQKKRKNKEA